jgi:hypothetical protein
MSMGYGANFAETISEENLIKVVGDARAVKGFIKAFTGYEFSEAEDNDYDELAQTISGEMEYDIDQDRRCYKALKAKWDKIAKKFKEVTGIELYINYHSVKDCGDCYDDIDGLYFNFSGRDLYQPTKKYKELKKKFGEDIVERQFFVTFG